MDSKGKADTFNKVVRKSYHEEDYRLDSLSMKLSKYVVFSTVVAALSAFSSGYNTGVTNIPNDIIRGVEIRENCINPNSFLPYCLYTSNDILWGFVIGVFALGGCFGSLTAGKVADKIGRRNALICYNLPFIIGGILLGTAASLTQLALGRFVVGISSGASSVLVSCYVGEIATAQRRGALGSVLQLMLVVGILISNIIGLVLSGVPYWRFLLALTAVPAIIQSFLLLRCKETPAYLIMKGKNETAYQNLQKLRSGYDIGNEYKAMVKTQKSEGNSTSVPISKIFSDKKYKRRVFGILGLHIITQVSGINGVITYSTTYFNEIIGKEYSSYSSIAISVLNLVFCLISMSVIERLGRKLLLLVSLFGMGSACMLIVVGSVFNYNLLVLVAVLMYISSFSIGLGPIPWLLMSEMFPTHILTSVTSVSIFLNWLSNFTVLMTFLYIKNALQNYTFVLFGAVCAFGFGFVFVFIPETKNKQIEQ